MCLLRLLLFWKTLLQRVQRYTLLCSLALCLFRTTPLLSEAPNRLLLSAAVTVAAASVATGSELSSGGFTSEHIKKIQYQREIDCTRSIWMVTSALLVLGSLFKQKSAKMVENGLFFKNIVIVYSR